MDLSAVKAIVERDADALLRAFGVPHWTVTIEYGPIDGADDDCHAQGQCHRLLDYESATISLDPAALDDEEHVLKVLRHEIAHIVLAPFDLMRGLMLIGLDGVEHEKTLTIVNHATECAVKNLSRMWHGLAEYHAERHRKEQRKKPATKAVKARRRSAAR